MTRARLVSALGYAGATSGRVVRELAALSHYGLVSRKREKDSHREMYRLSEAGRRLLVAKKGSSKFTEALQAAVRRPPVFREAMQQGGGELPCNLERILRELGIAPRASGAVAEILRASCRAAGIAIQREGSKVGETADSSARPSPVEAPGQRSVREELVHDEEPCKEFSFPILLPARQRGEVSFSVPSGLTGEGLKVFVEAVQFQLEQLRLHCREADVREFRRREADKN